MINTNITYLKKNKRIWSDKDISQTNAIIDEGPEEIIMENVQEVVSSADFSENEIMDVINELPDDYKTVFNLFTFEDYKHQDIAEMLHVSENTSKSKLLRARKLLQEKLAELAKKKIK